MTELNQLVTTRAQQTGVAKHRRSQIGQYSVELGEIKHGNEHLTLGQAQGDLAWRGEAPVGRTSKDHGGDELRPTQGRG
jgi:hypothetical protein